ncbi:MAG: PEP-CTERM sorting domain-containing protein [Gammaproteobacteria bacterium]
MLRPIGTGIICLMCLAFAASARASPITFRFDVTVTALSNANLLPGLGVTLGTVGTGEVTWESDALPRFPGSATYSGANNDVFAVASFLLRIGDLEVSSPFVPYVATVLTADPRAWDFQFESVEANHGYVDSAGLKFTSRADHDLSSASDPLRTFDPGGVEVGRFFAASPGPQGVGLRADLSNVTAVPEPSAWLLLGLGSMVTGAVRRWKR